MTRLIKIFKFFAFAFGILYVTFIIGGLIVKHQAQSPIDMASVQRDNAKLVSDKNGRQIEYFVYGNKNPEAPVIINMHGSGLDGTFEKAVHQSACEELGVRGIAISLPGVGNTDMKKGRQVIDWPKEDLQAILDAEQIDKFMITGHSQGNPHAMAAALYFKDRVTGLGLNAPLLPNDVTSEIGIAGALANENLKTTEELDRVWNAYWFFGLYLYVDAFAPGAPTKTLVSMGSQMENDPELIEMMRHTFSRSMIRGSAGNTWESALDVAYLWGFDPRDINTKNICIWHAADDSACPPEIGEFLAEHYRSKGATVNFKNDDIGFNHMTYSSSYYRKGENSMVKALLDGQKQNNP